MNTDLSAKVLRLVQLAMKFDPDAVSGEDTDDLDNRYYAINDAFIAECNVYLAKRIVQQVQVA